VKSAECRVSEEYVMHGVEKRNAMIRRDTKKRAFLLLSVVVFIGWVPY